MKRMLTVVLAALVILPGVSGCLGVGTAVSIVYGVAKHKVAERHEQDRGHEDLKGFARVYNKDRPEDQRLCERPWHYGAASEAGRSIQKMYAKAQETRPSVTDPAYIEHVRLSAAMERNFQAVELKFVAAVRQELAKAKERAEANLTAAGVSVEDNPQLEALAELDRYYETFQSALASMPCDGTSDALRVDVRREIEPIQTAEKSSKPSLANRLLGSL